MKLYLVRHGQTDFNAQESYNFPDTPLSPSGLEQAERIAERCSQLSASKVFSSEILRAWQTGEKIAQKTGLPHEALTLVREVEFPSEVLGKPNKDVLDIIAELAAHDEDPSWHYSDEENFTEIKNRAMQAVDFFAKQEEDIIVVTHGSFLRAIMGVMLEGDTLTGGLWRRLRKFLWTQNTGLTMCEYKNGKWKLLTWNDHAHLAD